ncbi:hypothetical protein B0H11DRAFT_2007983 [Mycena galericulata]|nr:hypothetical protein B0H11DRAFT_2007983 [Mycena galericulata]
MSRLHSRASPSTELHLEGDSCAIMGDADSAETLLNSATSLHRRSRQAPKRSVVKSSGSLRVVSLILHLALVAMHLVLIGIWAKELEHHLVFSLDNQKIVSFLITAVTQTFGTIYSALLVFVTQTLSMRRSLRRDQTLTATHDNAAAWAGIGSSVVHIWQQKVVPASMIGVLSVFLYLGNISVLHITTPALFALETFNASRTVPVGTQGLPNSKLDFSNGDDQSNMTSYGLGSLYYLPYVGGSPPIGLREGTLYDVLQPNTGTGNVTVNATGFNITCGYLRNVTTRHVETVSDWNWTVAWDTDGMVLAPWPVRSTQPGIISVVGYGTGADISNTALAFYSTIPIVDSSGHRGPSVDLTPPMETSVSTIYVFQCWQSLVNQTAVVDEYIQSTYIT